MYELTIESRFSAAHALTIQGQREPLHGHDWHITATFAGQALDPDGLLCDFHELERALNAITARFHNTNLNDLEPFGNLNPSAENVARVIAESLAAALKDSLPQGVALTALRTTEAPGCAATYRP